MNSSIKPVASANVNLGFHQSFIASVHHHRPFFSRATISSLSFRIPPPPSHKFTPIRASSSSSSSSAFPFSKNDYTNGNPKPLNPRKIPDLDFLKTLTSFPLSVIKTTLIATAAASAAASAAIFFARFHFFSVKPAYASPASVAAADVGTTASNDAVSEGETERTLEERLLSHPDDVEALRNLMEIRIKNRKTAEAIVIVEKLMELDPNEVEWPLMKSHLHVYNGELEFAKNGFSEIMKKDPFRVEAYHGLVMAASQDDSTEELKEIEKKIDEAMMLCKKENKKGDLRDFKLLLAQIRVIEGKYDEALKFYQDLVKEEPRDFRPYLCQGIIYTLLRKKVEADKNFEKYRRLVPKGHPYATYFEDNMIATKVFAQKVENEGAHSRS